MALDQLIYISRSSVPLTSPLDVADILEVSSRNNGRFRITGALTYSGDRFVQVLEGAPAALDWLVERLRYDPRHIDFDLLDRMPITARDFPEWSMVFPSMTPDSQAALAGLLSRNRRHAPAYREVLLKMVAELRRSLSGY